jgi:hypothetical protein
LYSAAPQWLAWRWLRDPGLAEQMGEPTALKIAVKKHWETILRILCWRAFSHRLDP